MNLRQSVCSEFIFIIVVVNRRTTNIGSSSTHLVPFEKHTRELFFSFRRYCWLWMNDDYCNSKMPEKWTFLLLLLLLNLHVECGIFFRSFLSVSWIKNWNFKIIYSSEKQSHYNNQTILWHRIMEFFLTIKHRFILFFLFILVCSSNKPLYNALEPDFFSCFVSGSTIYSGRAQFHWNYWYLALGKWYLFFIFIPNVTFSLVLFYYVSLLKFH